MDAAHAIDLVDLANARIFLAKLAVSSAKPDPPVISSDPVISTVHRKLAGGVFGYMGKNANSYPKFKSR
jgi:hypothetical protein